MLQTIENTREKDETFVDPEDEEVLLDEADDEFAGVPFKHAEHACNQT